MSQFDSGFAALTFDISRFALPRREIPHLPIIPVLRKTLLGPDEQYFPVVGQDSTIVSDVLMTNWHANVKDNILTVFMVNDPREHFPGVY